MQGSGNEYKSRDSPKPKKCTKADKNRFPNSLNQPLAGRGNDTKLETVQNKMVRQETVPFCDLSAPLSNHRTQCYMNSVHQTYAWRVYRGSQVHSYLCRLLHAAPCTFLLYLEMYTQGAESTRQIMPCV